MCCKELYKWHCTTFQAPKFFRLTCRHQAFWIQAHEYNWYLIDIIEKYFTLSNIAGIVLKNGENLHHQKYWVLHELEF